jgi:hypothetical protein
MMADTTKKRKRIKLSEGDLFELNLPDGRFGYGIIVKRGKLNNGGTPYIAVFASAHKERPNLASLVGEPVALMGWTTDALVYHDQWRVIAHNLPRPNLPLPNFKVEMGGKFYVTDTNGRVIDEATPSERELLDYKSGRAPIAFQNAFEALHGLRDWQENYDELRANYSQARIARPA